MSNEPVAVPTKELERETKFQKNWRPALGWTSVAGFAFALVIVHLINLIVKVMFWTPGCDVPVMERPDSTLLLEGLGLALGLAGYRMWEKVNGVAGGPPKQ